VSSILQITSPWIEILYLNLRGSLKQNDIPVTVFPRLRELTSDAFPIRNSYRHGDTTPNLALCPGLSHWHLTAFPWLRGGRDIFTAISTIAPSVTHLQFSNLVQEQWFPEALKRSFDAATHQQLPSDTSASGSSHIGKLPATVERVFVRSGPPPAPGGTCGNPYIAYSRLSQGLTSICKTDDRIVLLPRDEVYGKVRCLPSELEDRINGGEGCWNLGGSGAVSS